MLTPQQLSEIAQSLGLSEEQAKKLATELIKIDETIKNSIEHLKEQEKNLIFQQEVVGKIADEYGRIIEKEEIVIELAINEAKQREAAAKAAYQMAKTEEERKAALKDIVESQKDITGQLEKQKDILRAKEAGGGLAKLLGIDEANKNSLTYQIFANPDKVFDAFKSKVQDAGGATQAVFLSVAMKVQEATTVAFFAFDNAAASLNRATGAAGALNSVLGDTARGSTRFGISFEEAGKATEGLYSNLNTFNSLSANTQALLITNAAKLEQLGISAADSAKSIGLLSQIMGQSDIQSSKTINQMAALGVAIGKSPQQISQDFAQASDKLAGYGKNMVNVFKDLEIQSKATGVAVGDLIGVVEKFQTFEGAADAAGKLNAALGGNFINTMELLEASAENPAKAIDLLRTRLDEAGMSFDEMNFFEKKMITDAAGFKSIEEASRVLSMSNAEREKTIKNIEAQRASQEKLDKAMQASLSIQQKFQMLMANFAIVFEPAIDATTFLLDGLLKLADTGFGKVILAIAGVSMAFGVMFKIVMFGLTPLAGLLKTIGLIAPTTAPAGPALVSAGEAAAVAAKGFIQLGLGMLEIGGAIALAGLGIGLMIYSVSKLLDSVVSLASVLSTDLVLSLTGLGIAMGIVGVAFSNPVVLFGMAAFATSLAAIVGIINQLDENKSLNFKVITESLTKASVVTTTSTRRLGDETQDMIDAINNFSLSTPQADALARILNALPNTGTQTQAANNTTVEVFIGQERLNQLVTNIVNRTSTGSITTPATLSPASRT